MSVQPSVSVHSSVVTASLVLNFSFSREALLCEKCAQIVTLLTARDKRSANVFARVSIECSRKTKWYIYVESKPAACRRNVPGAARCVSYRGNPSLEK